MAGEDLPYNRPTSPQFSLSQPIVDSLSTDGGIVMVWDGVSQHHRTELVVIAGNLNAVRYREDILLPRGTLPASLS